MAGLKTYARPRRVGAVVAVVLVSLCAGATYHASRVLAPPEFAGDSVALVDEPRSASAHAATAADPHGYIDTYAARGAPERPIPANRTIVLASSAALELRGWTAASIVPPVLARSITVAIDGRPVPIMLRATERPDVAQAFREPALVRSGYATRLRAPALPGSYALEVRASAKPGAPAYAVGGPLTLVVR